MPVLNLNEDGRSILVTALIHERVRLMAEWKKRVEDYDSSAFSCEADCAELDEHADDVTDLQRKIEVAEYAPKDAWHHERGWLRNEAFAKHCQQKISENITGEGIQPGTWTTLPEGFDVDSDPFEITDPGEPVTAGLDTQSTADGKFLVNIQVDGKTAEVKVDGEFLKMLNELRRRS